MHQISLESSPIIKHTCLAFIRNYQRGNILPLTPILCPISHPVLTGNLQFSGNDIHSIHNISHCPCSCRPLRKGIPHFEHKSRGSSVYNRLDCIAYTLQLRPWIPDLVSHTSNTPAEQMKTMRITRRSWISFGKSTHEQMCRR